MKLATVKLLCLSKVSVLPNLGVGTVVYRFENFVGAFISGLLPRCGLTLALVKLSFVLI